MTPQAAVVRSATPTTAPVTQPVSVPTAPSPSTTPAAKPPPGRRFPRRTPARTSNPPPAVARPRPAAAHTARAGARRLKRAAAPRSTARAEPWTGIAALCRRSSYGPRGRGDRRVSARQSPRLRTVGERTVDCRGAGDADRLRIERPARISGWLAADTRDSGDPRPFDRSSAAAGARWELHSRRAAQRPASRQRLESAPGFISGPRARDPSNRNPESNQSPGVQIQRTQRL